MALIVRYVLCIALTALLISAEVIVMTFNDQVQYTISKMMPNLNSSCVAKACPVLDLGFLCPKNGPTAILELIVNTANRCMRNPMCGFLLDPEVIPEVTFTTEGRPGFGNASVCSVLKGATFDNASHAQITGVSRAQQQTNISLFMPDLTVDGRMSCDGGQVNLTFYHYMTFNCTIVYDGNDVTVVNPKFTMLYIAYNTITPQGSISRSFTQFDPQVVASEGAMLGAVYRSFLDSFYKTVFKVASGNCKF